MGSENDKQTQPDAQMCHRQGKCSATLSSLNPRLEGHRVKGEEERRYASVGSGQPAGSALCYGGTAWAVGGCWVFRVVGTKECTCPLLQTVFSPTEKSRQISQNPKMGVCVTLEGSMALCGGLTVHTGLLPGASSHSAPPTTTPEAILLPQDKRLSGLIDFGKLQSRVG